jgi:hypothetical protein
MRAFPVATWIIAWLPFSLSCGGMGEGPKGGSDGADADMVGGMDLLPEATGGDDGADADRVGGLDLSPEVAGGGDVTFAAMDLAATEASTAVFDQALADAPSADMPAEGSGPAVLDAPSDLVDLPDEPPQDPQDSARDAADDDSEGDDPADVPMMDTSDALPDDTPTEAGAPTQPELVGAPLIFAPTSQGFGLNVVLASGDPSVLRAHLREAGTTVWTDLGLPIQRAYDLAEWAVSGLDAGQRYEYEVVATAPVDAGVDRLLYRGSAVTQRDPGASFTFDMLTDSHIQPCEQIPSGTEICADDFLSWNETTLLGIAGEIRADQPDFLIHLGDMLDYHLFGFNDPPPDSQWARLAYLNYRRLTGDALGNAAHFPTIGNWDGESGFYSPEEIERSMTQRLLYIPAPGPETYPQGGSPNHDYYAFTWGDALFVVLNVMTYTTAPHLLAGNPGLPDDWTLGASQRTWLEATLAGAKSKWRFLFIHHPVGGNAGDDDDTAYGRGGGRAAYVGEQALVHQLMLKYGVRAFFYGHDHVFTDMVVDGIHYTLPGSAGAPWKFEGYLTGYTDYWTDSGHGRVTVSPDSVVVDLIAAGGSVLSSYTLR